jgi:hypothetical protein
MGNTAGPLPPMLPTQVGGTSFPARLAPLAGSQSVPLALPAGARVVAEVVQTQTDGQVLLRLGQTLLAAQLPGQHQVGEQLPLIVLSEPGSQPALLMAPPGSLPASQSELSSTAQLLARLQQQPAQALRAAEPLWPQPDGVASPSLAQSLASSVGSSGLFYESHLAAWVQAELPTQALLQEPQGRLSAAAQASAPTSSPAPAGQAQAPARPELLATGSAAGAAPAPLPGGDRAGASGASQAQAAQPAQGTPAQGALAAAGGAPQQLPVPAARLHAAAGVYAAVQAQSSATAAGTVGTTAQAIPAQLQALVQQQLATLAQGAVVWAGQAWPGQELEWRIEPDDSSPSGADAAPSQRAWTSVLRLDLPRLGQLVVTLQLSGAAPAGDAGAGAVPSAASHLRVRVEHASQAGRALHAHGGEFRQALRDAGLQLDELALRPLAGNSHG